MSSPTPETSTRAGDRQPASLATRLASRRMRWLFVLILVGPYLALQAPLEVGRWKLAAAIQARADGKKDRAYSALADAMNWMPNQPRLYLKRAEWRLHDGLREEALADGEQILVLTNESAGGLKLHSGLMQAAGNHAQAVADWERINEISLRSGRPSRADALNSLAYCQAVGKIDLDSALARANEALELSGPKNERRRGWSLWEFLGLSEEDEQIPDFLILDTRGYLRYLKGDYKAALEDMNQAIAKLNAKLDTDRKKNGAPGPIPPQHLRLLSDPTGSGSFIWTLAVTHYHRALVLKAMGLDERAANDLARVRAWIGGEPDETLF